MARTFTHSFVRTHFLKAELVGLAAGTVKNSTFISAIKYGVDNKCIREIEINLNDGKQDRAVVQITVDWERHEALLKRDTQDLIGFEGEGQTVTGHVFQQIIQLLNEFQSARQLIYWWNIVWISNGSTHDANCGITRSASGIAKISSAPNKTIGRTMFHELLEELSISFKIDDN